MENQNINNTDFLNEVTKKLAPIARKQEIDSKYLKAKEDKENELLALENKLKMKVYQEKQNKFNLEKKTIDKIQRLSLYLSQLNPDTISKIDSTFSSKKDSQIQTEEDETGILIEKVSMLEKENQNNISKKAKYKKELQLAQKENSELKIENDKIVKENKLLKSSLDELTKIKNDNEKIIKELKIENSNLNTTILNHQKTIEELNKIKKLFEEKVQIDISKNKIDQQLQNELSSSSLSKNPFDALITHHLLNHVISYLSINDICNIKLVNKSLSISIVNSCTILKNFYSKIIDAKNQKISEIQKYDIKKEYLIQNPKLEQLIKEYAITNKLPGKDLKQAIGKCLNFLNKDVKIPLGYNPSKIKSNLSSIEGSGYNTPGGTSTNGGYGSFFGGIKSMFWMGSSNQTPVKTETNSGYQTPTLSKSRGGSKPGSRGMSFSSNTPIQNRDDVKNSLDSFDKFLIEEMNNGDSGIASQYEFDFQTSDDIKMYLNKFLKSNFPVDKLTAFIKELCTGYSELLYSSNRSLMEIKEIEIVKNALNERYKHFEKLSSELENQLKVQNLNTPNNHNDSNISFSNKIYGSQNQIIQKNSLDEEEKEKLLQQIETNKMYLEIYQQKANLYRDKYEQVKMDYDQFRNIFVKENRGLKYQLDTVLVEKNTLQKQIDEFNKFFEQVKINVN